MNLIYFKKCETIVKRTVKMAKQNSLKKYCTELRSFTPTGEVWKKVKPFTNIHYK